MGTELASTIGQPKVESAKNKTAGIPNPASEIQVQYGTHTPAMVQFPYIKLTPDKSHTPLKERAGGERVSSNGRSQTKATWT